MRKYLRRSFVYTFRSVCSGYGEASFEREKQRESSFLIFCEPQRSRVLSAGRFCARRGGQRGSVAGEHDATARLERLADRHGLSRSITRATRPAKTEATP